MALELLWIDYLIIAVYLIGILILGGYLTRHIHSAKDYFLAGRMLPFWAIGMSIVVSDIGATDMIGLAGASYRYGVAAANFDWIGSFPAMILAAFIFVPYFWRTGVYTIPEFLGRRYNLPTRVAHSLIWIIVIALDIGIILYACAILLQSLMGLGYWQAVIMTALFLGIYTVCSGLSGVVLTDAAQLVIMFIGGATIVVLGLWEVGGWDQLVVQVKEQQAQHFDLLLPANTKTPYPWTGILFGLGFVMSTAYFVSNQTIVQRVLGAKSEWDAKASMLFGALFKALIPVLVVTPGLIGLVLYSNDRWYKHEEDSAKYWRIKQDGTKLIIRHGESGGEERHETITYASVTQAKEAFVRKIAQQEQEKYQEATDEIMPRMIKKLLPPGMTGLMLVAFLAAMMSSIDSLLNSVATLFTKDIYQNLIAPEADERQLLWVGRVCTVVILTVGVISSPISSQYEGIYEYMQTLLSFFQGPTLAVLLLGIFWKRCTAWGGFFGLTLGVLSAAMMTLYQETLFTISDPFLFVSLWSCVFAAIVAIIVSLFTLPHDEDHLYGLVYGLVMHSDKAQQALEKRANGGETNNG